MLKKAEVIDMSIDLPQPPYPEDTRAKGMEFDIDPDRLYQSKTWVITPDEYKPWLLRMWVESWRSIPTGTFENDPEMIAARIGMPLDKFESGKRYLMRGWILHSDGLYYHNVITEKVMKFTDWREKQAAKKKAWRDKRKAEKEGLSTGDKKETDTANNNTNVHQDNGDVPRDNGDVPRDNPNVPVESTTKTPMSPLYGNGNGYGNGTVTGTSPNVEVHVNGSYNPNGLNLPTDVGRCISAKSTDQDPQELSTTEQGETDLLGDDLEITSKKRPDCPYKAIVNAYHEILPELRHVRALSAARKNTIRARWQDELKTLEAWEKYFRYVKQSKFLMGLSQPRKPDQKPFQADLDWLIKPANMLKIYEGKYHG